jgi:hypothetical protein
VIRKDAFIDSVAFKMPALMPKEKFLPIREALVSERRKRVRGRTSFKIEKVRWPAPNENRFHLIFWIHQPTRRALELFQRDGRGTLYAVHFALDLIPDSTWNLSELHDYLVKRVGVPWMAKTPTRWHKTTAYIGERERVFQRDGASKRIPTRTGKKYVVYSDRESKVSGEPCTHIELRIAGAQYLQREKLRNIAALLQLNHRAVWNRLRLFSPVSERHAIELMAERLKRRRTTRRSTRAADRPRRLRVAGEILAEGMKRISRDRGTMTAYDWQFLCRQVSLLRSPRPNILFRDEDPFWLLPNPSNSLWGGS